MSVADCLFRGIYVERSSFQEISPIQYKNTDLFTHVLQPQLSQPCILNEFHSISTQTCKQESKNMTNSNM